MYVLELEQALQSIVPDVMMPYWDETSAASLESGIPAILTQETFELDGKAIPNPLRSFVLPVALSDGLPGDDRTYEKPKGYETVRYPLSGLVGTEAARKATEQHNARFPDPAKNAAYLDENVVAWLHGSPPTPKDPNPRKNGFGLRRASRSSRWSSYARLDARDSWRSEARAFVRSGHGVTNPAWWILPA